MVGENVVKRLAQLGVKAIQRSNHIAVLVGDHDPYLVPESNHLSLLVSLRGGKNVKDAVIRQAAKGRREVTAILRDDLWSWFYCEGGREMSLRYNYGFDEESKEDDNV